ncbi:SMI1/KNR4 family protein [Ruminococcus sp.]|uniref:SMI1/KNR4 family protein n=1 Tax=Ruminococcus sp. TaxID=41978 RepID=UPI0025F0BEDD|nr:SMI1/KNR4 family protein [Ruminococcus sp.]MBR1432061.1 SMI1/KNR4 family protein [Ruminococcus sp.]
MFTPDEKPRSLQECFERLKKAREIVVSDEYGYTEKDFEFNPPASEELIEKCENDYGFKLPEDCKEFFRISNGIRIFNTVIYGVDYIGMSDPFVPDDYLCFGRNESTSERLTFSKDGKFYLCYDFEPEPWEFEDYLLLKLEKCEELIDEHNEEVETKKRREAGITEEQELEELYAQIMNERKRIDKEKGLKSE